MIKKITPVFFGILLIVLFEVSLYFTGRIFLYARNPESAIGSNSYDKLILCIGDSHTFGVGASSKYSYPGQLETLLNLNNPGTVFKVANLGIPGNSTGNQIERLKSFLSKNKTALVILLTGRNNYYEVRVRENKSFSTNLIIRIQRMRTYKLLQYVLNRYFQIGGKQNINAPVKEAKYEDYMSSQLARAKSLCEEHGDKLVLLSYHNSHNEVIENFARQSGILYFNLCRDFLKAISQEDRGNFVSSDASHMNRYGYRIFAELLYKKMFLHATELGLGLNPPSKRRYEDSFCQNAQISYLTYLQGKSLFYEN